MGDPAQCCLTHASRRRKLFAEASYRRSREVGTMGWVSRRLNRAVLAMATAGVVVANLVGAAPARAALTVVPNANAAVEGDSNNAFPFSCAAAGRASMRYQQVYAATELPSGIISQVNFRPDATFGAPFGPTTLSNVTITLSTTSKAVGALDTTFANNVGADVTTVHSGNLTLSSAATGGPPRNFDIVISLQHAFVYNNAAGNLLLDVTVPTCIITKNFDAVSNGGTSTSRLAAEPSSSASANVPTPAFGLVTQFNVNPCDNNITGSTGSVNASGPGLTCIANANITGSITISNGASVALRNATVGGAINDNGGGDLTMCASHVHAVTVQNTTGTVRVGDPAKSCAGNTIAGSASLNHNTGFPGPVVGANTISGGLFCSANTNTVINDGSPNTVTGSRTGQCMGL
jgi:hypothetical protein